MIRDTGLTLLNVWTCIQSAKKGIILKLTFNMWCALTSMVMTPGKRIQWTLIFQLCTKKYIEIFFLYLGGKFWSDLPEFFTNFTKINTRFKDLNRCLMCYSGYICFNKNEIKIKIRRIWFKAIGTKPQQYKEIQTVCISSGTIYNEFPNYTHDSIRVLLFFAVVGTDQCYLYNICQRYFIGADTPT